MLRPASFASIFNPVMPDRNEAPPSPAYPRDLYGYGDDPPQARWPAGARIAVQFVINYEEGGERCVLHGDAESESYLPEVVGARSVPGRQPGMESVYEYGSRVGVWRLFRLFREREIPITVFAVGMALERNPAVADAAMAAGFEVCAHGYRWIDYQSVPETVEREHVQRTVESIRRLTGERPLGWYTGRSGPNTRRLVVEEGGFLYDSDDYSDDLPFWTTVAGRPHLVVPYSMDANDMRFALPQGFNAGEQFFSYLRDAFDVLYAEGAHTPRMMSIGLHCRLIGRPGRFASLQRFVDHVLAHDAVWCCRRIDIARHWRQRHPHGGGRG